MAHPPTRRQLALLKRLATERGMTFTWPDTAAQASRQINRLLAAAKSPRHEVRADRDATTRDRFDTGAVASVRDTEITGYGSTARWS